MLIVGMSVCNIYNMRYLVLECVNLTHKFSLSTLSRLKFFVISKLNLFET